MQSRASCLRKTLDDNNYFGQQLRQFLPSQNARRPCTSPPAFELPPIPDIQSCILEAGAPQTLAKSLSRVYHARANHLHEATFNKLHEVWRRLEEAPGEWAVATFQNAVDVISEVFLSQLKRWQTQTLEGVAQRQRNSRAGKHSCRPAFNAEYVPLLESYFKINAYPTASDRVSLARKTGMTPRQIEVWFQNHRNRAPKNGQMLNRLREDQLTPDSPPLGLAQRLPTPPRHSASTRGEASTESTPFPLKIRSAVSPTPSRSTTATPLFPGSTCTSSPNPSSSSYPLDPPAPPHAFPTVYPPICDYDPFPVKETGRPQFPPVRWPRLPSQINPRKRKRPVSVEELANEFAHRLNLRRNGDLACSRLNQPTAPWHSATRISPCRGRHPALVVTNTRNQDSTPRTHRLPRRNASGRRSRRSGSPQLPPRTRIRCTSSSSVSTASSSSLPVTPENSPVPLPQSMDKIPCLSELDIGSLRAFPDPNVIRQGFLVYAGYPVPFGLVGS